MPMKVVSLSIYGLLAFLFEHLNVLNVFLGHLQEIRVAESFRLFSTISTSKLDVSCITEGVIFFLLSQGLIIVHSSIAVYKFFCLSIYYFVTWLFDLELFYGFICNGKYLLKTDYILL